VRLLSVVGTRPQLIKAAALVPALRERHTEILVETGQHWDDEMAGAFFRELGLPPPDHELGVGGGSHTEQTAGMLRALEPVARETAPDAVLVYGDTNSTLAGALVAAKLGIPVAHVEAGLRSHDRSMPEEVNRLVADHLARWLFAPTRTAVQNLAAEGIVEGVHLVGDLLRDLAARTLATVRDARDLDRVADAIGSAGAGLALATGRYAFVTVHRQENRTPDALQRLARVLEAIVGYGLPVVFAVHPGTRTALIAARIAPPRGVHMVDPLGYRSSLALQLHAALIVTDSGGVQREADWLTVPCLVLRQQTEWVEALAVSGGRVTLVGLDADRTTDALGRLGSPDELAGDARRRASELTIRADGAGEAIADVLDRR
jgi:UDP-N-acetylglucosamine 2-epimerase